MELVYIRRDRKTNAVWIVMVTIASSTNIDYAIIFIQWYAMCTPKKYDTPLYFRILSVVLHAHTQLSRASVNG